MATPMDKTETKEKMISKGEAKVQAKEIGKENGSRGGRRGTSEGKYRIKSKVIKSTATAKNNPRQEKKNRKGSTLKQCGRTQKNRK